MIPAKIVIGDSVSWENCKTADSLGNDITSATYTLTHYIKKSDATTPTSIIATAGDNGGWNSTLSIAATTALSAGTYYWSARATKSGAAVTIATGQLKVVASLSATASYDGRSQARQDLDAVQAAMRAIYAGGMVAEYTIGGRSMRKMPMEDLILIEKKLKFQVANEENADRIAAGLGDGKNLFVRFRR